MASQVPGGALADAARDKRAAIAAAIIATLVSALLIALWPTLLSIGSAEVLHAFAGSVIGPAIAALTLALSTQAYLARGSAATPAMRRSAMPSPPG